MILTAPGFAHGGVLENIPSPSASAVLHFGSTPASFVPASRSSSIGLQLGGSSQSVKLQPELWLPLPGVKLDVLQPDASPTEVQNASETPLLLEQLAVGTAELGPHALRHASISVRLIVSA